MVKVIKNSLLVIYTGLSIQACGIDVKASSSPTQTPNRNTNGQVQKDDNTAANPNSSGENTKNSGAETIFQKVSMTLNWEGGIAVASEDDHLFQNRLELVFQSEEAGDIKISDVEVSGYMKCCGRPWDLDTVQKSFQGNKIILNHLVIPAAGYWILHVNVKIGNQKFHFEEKIFAR